MFITYNYATEDRYTIDYRLHIKTRTNTFSPPALVAVLVDDARRPIGVAAVLLAGLDGAGATAGLSTEEGWVTIVC